MTPPAGEIANPVRLTETHCRLARTFAHRVIAGYVDGSKSTEKSLNGVERNLAVQAAARAAEIAFCVFWGLSPFEKLDWGRRPDRGCDITHAGIRWDVKHTADGRQFLLWPRSKNDDYGRKEFDALALVIGNAPIFTVWGWISKAAFLDEMQVAGPGNKLEPGTWHVHRDRLTRFEEAPIVPHTKRDRQWFLDRLEMP